jgi:hypothetical protein
MSGRRREERTTAQRSWSDAALAAVALLLLDVVAQAAGVQKHGGTITVDDPHVVVVALAAVLLGAILLVALEAWIIKAALELPYLPVLWYTVLANLLTGLVTGQLDAAAQAASAGSAARIEHAHVSGLVAQGIICWAIEGVILVWFLGARRGSRLILKAAAVAIAVTFVVGYLALWMPLMAYLMATSHS